MNQFTNHCRHEGVREIQDVELETVFVHLKSTRPVYLLALRMQILCLLISSMQFCQCDISILYI